MVRHAPDALGPDGWPRGLTTEDTLWCHRFRVAAEAWAKGNGFMTGSTSYPAHVDWRGLAEVGVTRVTALERCRAGPVGAGLLPGQRNHRGAGAR